MDRSKAVQIATRALPRYRWAMQLQRWNISIVWGPTSKPDVLTSDKTLVASIFVDPAYHRAVMQIDNDVIDDAAELHFTIRHEMFHIFHAELELVRQCMGQHLKKDAFDAVEVVRDNAVERLVFRLERMFDHGLGLGARDMLKLSKQYIDKKRNE